MHRQHVGWIRVENYEKYLLRDKDRTERIESLFKTRSELNKTLTVLKEEKHVTKKIRRKINRIQDRLRDISDDIENMYFSMSANLKPTRVAVPSSETKGRTAEGMRLRMFVNRNPDENIKYLQLYWEKQGSNWLKPWYVSVLRSSGLQVLSIELYLEAPEDGTLYLVAGEVGYVIGETFTSMTGWSLKNDATTLPSNLSDVWGQDPLFEILGRVQIVCLGKWLQRSGIKFWNLGHPPRPDLPKYPMRYKHDLGAKVYRRADFMKAWRFYVNEKIVPEDRSGDGKDEGSSVLKDGAEFNYWNEIY